MTVLTPHEIDVRIAQLDAVIRTAESEAQNLALPVVSGDTTSTQRLAEVEASIIHYRADRETLCRARAGAAAIEEAETARVAAEKKAQHMEAARQGASEMVALSAALDAALVTAQQAQAAVLEKSRSVLQELRNAEEQLTGFYGWQTSVSQKLSEHVAKFFDVAPNQRPEWSVETQVEQAWSFLLVGQNPGDEI